MLYNDFQILNDEAYKILQSNYQKASSLNTFNRKNTIDEIYQKLSFCSFVDIFSLKKLNNYIKTSINYSKHSINKILANLQTTFKPTTKSISTTSGNIFEYINSLLETLTLLNKWLQQEEKEYYKSIALNSFNEIIKIIISINSSLEKSNIYFFKFM